MTDLSNATSDPVDAPANPEASAGVPEAAPGQVAPLGDPSVLDGYAKSDALDPTVSE